jgi:hypothetical protein
MAAERKYGLAFAPEKKLSVVTLLHFQNEEVMKRFFTRNERKRSKKQ